MTRKALHMEGCAAVELVFKIDLHRIADIGPDHQSPYFRIGLRYRQRKQLQRLLLNPL